MKARPIENVLEHCKKVDKDYSRFLDCDDEMARGHEYRQYCINLGWKGALKYIINTYNCTPKQVERGLMGVKRLSGGQYYVEMEIAEKVISRFVFDNKEDYEGFIKSMKEEGNKITAQGEFQGDGMTPGIGDGMTPGIEESVRLSLFYR